MRVTRMGSCKRRTLIILLFGLWWVTTMANGQAEEKSPQALLPGSRLLFLGDSITYAGDYIAFFEAWLTLHPELQPDVVLDLGLPSETVSGLTETGHANGQFPRPHLEERLDRVLALTKPTLVIACYGMNCAIYQPLDPERLKAYQTGIMNLRAAVQNQGAALILMTPPCYDDQQKPLSFSYNDVLSHYSNWLVEQRHQGWRILDLHAAMTATLQQRRQADPKMTFHPDGVHPNELGHWVITQQLVDYFGGTEARSADSASAMLEKQQVTQQILPLLQKRKNILRDAYLNEAKHLRPGMAKGLPIPQAETAAQTLTRQIAELLPAKPHHTP